MKLGYELIIEQSQKLVMTPELIQAIQILQFNIQELDTFVQEELLINPVLEKAERSDMPAVSESSDSSESLDAESSPSQDTQESTLEKDTEFDWAEYFKERGYDDISYRQWTSDPDKNTYSYEHFVPSDTTLTDHLLLQLQLINLRPTCKAIAKYLIEALDENGYLTSSVTEVAKIFKASEKTIMEALGIVQGLDPIGVGARDIRECLLIQMAHCGYDSPKIRRMIEDHLEDIGANRLGAIAKGVGLSIKEVQEIRDTIKTLEPKPGRQYSCAGDNRYIIPDVTVEKVDGEYIVLVNDCTAPRLNISPFYQKMLKESEKDSNLSTFLTGRFNSALWLIKSIEQRRQTIYNVVTAVVRYQVDFLDYGIKHLKTLTLKQIAEEVGVHESTVSRSINGKYMQTPRGLFEIRYFFTSGVSGIGGEGIASESIKMLIRELVENEEPKAPLSDHAITEELKHRGIDISRRTVAKYRDEIGLPSSSKRKRY